MSTEIHVGGLSSSIPGAIELTGEFDRVLHTAADRPHTDTLPALRDPAADHGDEELKRRRDDVEEKHERIRQVPRCLGARCGRARAWPTRWPGSHRAAISGSISASDQSAILLFINRTSRAVIADNVQSSRVFEEELAGLGFQLKERPWYDDPYQVVAELCHNKRVATDLGGNAVLARPPRRRRPASAAPAADRPRAAAAAPAGPNAEPGGRGHLPQLSSLASAKPTSPATWPTA